MPDATITGMSSCSRRRIASRSGRASGSRTQIPSVFQVMFCG